ncbi:MAG: DUF6901 family protein [Myxococcota bacterium]
MSKPKGPWFIRYEFTLPESKRAEFTVNLDPKTLENLAPPPATPPDWTRLDFEQCPNCPLTTKDCAACPVALKLSDVVAEFAHVFSFEKVNARVTVPERAYLAENVSAQSALSSLLGVYMVTSGCPLLSKLRPMVRLHLPFAGELETLARSTSMYLLGQYFVMKHGGTPDWSLEGLAEIYRQTSKVNRAFARRLRAAAPKDANVNALIILHSFAEAVPDTIEDQLDELGFLFQRS